MYETVLRYAGPSTVEGALSFRGTHEEHLARLALFDEVGEPIQPESVLVRNNIYPAGVTNGGVIGYVDIPGMGVARSTLEWFN